MSAILVNNRATAQNRLPSGPAMEARRYHSPMPVIIEISSDPVYPDDSTPVIDAQEEDHVESLSPDTKEHAAPPPRPAMARFLQQLTGTHKRAEPIIYAMLHRTATSEMVDYLRMVMEMEFNKDRKSVV